jgi:S1/P1 Nuclease
MKRGLLFVALHLSLAFCVSARAWDSFGHMMVASIAWHQLDAATQTKITTLLKRNPDYDSWIAGVSAADRDEFAFMKAATWPDVIKSESQFTDANDTPTGPNAARNVGYADSLRHRYWHYIDFPFSPDHTPLGNPDPTNIQTQIHAFRLKLKSSSASASVKSYDLVWLLHLVGDAHQPLHATSRFVAALPQGDHGGGDVMICKSSCSASKSPLHPFWDDVLGTGTSAASARTAANKLSAPDSSAAAVDDEAVWLQESFTLAKSDAYKQPPIKGGKGPYALSVAYKAMVKKDAQQRVALAGARLAHLLQSGL